MAAPIGALQAYRVQQGAVKTESAKPSGDVDFADKLVDALQDAGDAETKADDLAKRFANGDRNVGIHEVMIATEKANIQLRYAVALKNKILDAYRELMNTQV